MIGLKKIIVALDGSDNSFRALDMAVSLSRHYKAKITGIFVIDFPPVLKYAIIDPGSKDLVNNASEFMEKAELCCKKNKISFNNRILYGKTGSCITKFADKGKYDAIVIGARGIGDASEIFLGSVSHYVIHKSKIPVLIVK